MSEDHQTAASLRRVTTLCGVAVVLLGILGFVGWIFGSRLLGGISPAYFPMAPSAALAFILLGAILALHSCKPQPSGGGILVMAVVGLVMVFGMLDVVELFIEIDLTHEELLFPIHEKFGEVPLYQISPLTSFIFFLAGIALLLLLGFRTRWTTRQLAGGLGSLVCIAGFVATVGYLFGTPLLYGGSIIPVAATTAVAFILLGNGLMAAAGPDAFPVRFLAGPTVQARLLRLLIPLAIATIILHGLAQKFVVSLAHLNHALLTALVALVFVAVIGVVVTGASRVIAHALEQALAERIRAEKDLYQSEQMLHLVLDSIPVGVFWKDRDLRYLGCNTTTAQAAGYPNPHAIIGKTDFDLPWKDAAEAYRAVDRQVMETGNPRINFEETITSSDGSLRWLETSKVPLRRQDGSIFGVLGIYEDITARKQAEKQLKLKERILDGACDSIFLHDLEGHFLYVNEAACKNRGYEKEALLAKDLSGLIAPEFAQVREMYLRDLFARSEIVFESAHLRQDGSIMPVEIHARTIDLDDEELILSVARDITERKQTRKILAEQLAFINLLMDTIPSAIFYKDTNGFYLGCNKSFEEYIGIPKKEMIGKSVYELFPKELADKYQQMDQELFQNPGTQTYEFLARWADGTNRSVIFNKATFSDAAGEIAGLIGVITDISERKRAEKALVESEELYRSLFENMLNGFAYCKMLFDQDQPQDYIFLDVNNSFEGLTGLKNVIGKKVSEVIPGLRESDPELFEIYGRVALTGKPERFEVYVQALQMWFSISVYSPAKEYFVAVFDVITERKQAEEELRSAAQKWRTTFNAISDAVALLDRDCQILQCNQAMADLVGKSLPEILGRQCWELVHNTVGPIEGCPLGRMKDSGHRETLTIRMADRWLHVMVDPILNESGQVIGGVHIIADITERKIAQDRIQDLNTLLKSIKEVNEALLRAKSEMELFQQTCELMTQVPYVRFVWIGLKEPDSFVVKPVAWAGQEEGYLSAVRVTWDDSPQGLGPTGTAIKTGHPVVVRDTATDPTYDPWREEALRRGYLSAIVLPLEHEGITQGSLNVYAGKQEAFGQEELEFLNQVAGDIVVGIRSLRLAQRLKQSLQQMQTISQQTVEALAATVEMRDPYIAGHQQWVTRLALALAAEMGLAEDRLEGLRKAGYLHDIGKIMVPAEILSKPGRINDYEMDLIKAHSQAGYDILAKIDFPWPVAQIVLQHHERLDGSGYPQGLQGPDILQEAKILAVADVVEAMASHRPYRAALGIDKALEEISKNKGVLYDPEAVNACVKLFTEKEFRFELEPEHFKRVRSPLPEIGLVGDG